MSWLHQVRRDELLVVDNTRRTACGPANVVIPLLWWFIETCFCSCSVFIPYHLELSAFTGRKQCIQCTRPHWSQEWSGSVHNLPNIFCGFVKWETRGRNKPTITQRFFFSKKCWLKMTQLVDEMNVCFLHITDASCFQQFPFCGWVSAKTVCSQLYFILRHCPV